MSISRERILDPSLEWLEPDGLGGFASGTASGVRTRRYHGLLAAALRPPTARVMLVNALDAWIDLGDGPRALSSHRFLPGVVHPDGASRIVGFTHEPFPTWTFELEGGGGVEHALFVSPGAPRVVITWRLLGPKRPGRPARLTVRPLLSCRDLHGLRREDPSFRLDALVEWPCVRWKPAADLAGIVALANATYHHAPLWYRDFLYEEERARGYDHVEDLGSPGVFAFDLAQEDATLVLAAEAPGLPAFRPPSDVALGGLGAELRARERAVRSEHEPLDRAADAYVVRRDGGHTIIAGYPWFTDWGRDTFLAMRGLLIARGRLAQSRSILLAWSEHLSAGMLPNRFPERGEEPELNSVDAALWFAIAVHDHLAADAELPRERRSRLEDAVQEVLEHYSRGTRFGIRADADGLLACGESGTQLTWMDAKVDGQVITPRIGKPVEVQALWIHALDLGGRKDARWRALAETARTSFEARFWNEGVGGLHDVVDVDHVAGRNDASVRPNQILAVGGLPSVLLGPARARAVVDLVERRLLTPLGLRTLAREDPRYAPVYAGDVLARDGAYHQGTVWPWLLGPFVEAWVRVRGASAATRRAARERFLPALRRHLGEAGLGHVSEIADGDPPHTPRGCPFQAWSLGELLRLERSVLAEGARTSATPPPQASGSA